MCAATDPSEVGASPGDPVVPVPVPVAAEVITSRRNPLVGRLRSLHDARGRRQSRQLLLEGTHLIEEMLRIGLKPDLLVATPAWIARHPHLLAALPAATPQAEVTPPPPQRSADKHREAGGEAGQLQASSGGVSVLGRDKRPSSRPSC